MQICTLMPPIVVHKCKVLPQKLVHALFLRSGKKWFISADTSLEFVAQYQGTIR